MKLSFAFFLTVFQSYQDHERLTQSKMAINVMRNSGAFRIGTRYYQHSKSAALQGLYEPSLTLVLASIKKKSTLKCLSIGTPKIINFPFVSNGKLMVFRCPNIQAHYNEAVIYLNFGTPKNNEFSIWNKWKIYYFQVSQYLSTLGYNYV